MQTIIGLGKAGCAIADRFSQFPQYKIYKIDEGLKKIPSHYAMKRHETPEQYEANCPNLEQFLEGVNQEILFITSCGNVSGASLRILEQIKDKCKINILYIKPDVSFLSDTNILQNNLLFNVFQEYARSGVFERVYLIDNLKLVDIVGDLTIREYYEKLNEVIVSNMHMINVFNNTDSVMNNFSTPIETARISTFGLTNFEDGEEKLFFSLDNLRKKRYYYAVPEDVLKSDGQLMKKISKQLKENKGHDKMKIDYGVYTTNYDSLYVYFVADSSRIQKKTLTKENN